MVAAAERLDYLFHVALATSQLPPFLALLVLPASHAIHAMISV